MGPITAHPNAEGQSHASHHCDLVSAGKAYYSDNRLWKVGPLSLASFQSAWRSKITLPLQAFLALPLSPWTIRSTSISTSNQPNAGYPANDYHFPLPCPLCACAVQRVPASTAYSSYHKRTTILPIGSSQPRNRPIRQPRSEITYPKQLALSNYVEIAQTHRETQLASCPDRPALSRAHHGHVRSETPSAARSQRIVPRVPIRR